MASLPAPKAPSSLVKVTRWTLFGLGILYGSTRHSVLKKREDARRAKEEEERPAREAAMKAEKERRNQEEMAYLAKEVGVNQAGSADKGSGPTYRSDCGCSY